MTPQDLIKITGRPYYTGAIPGHMALFEAWRLPQYQEWAEKQEAANVFYECYQCKKSYRDLGIQRALKDDKEVLACHVCMRKGMKPKGKTKHVELHRIPDAPQPKRKYRHGYYEAGHKDCDCVYCANR